MKTISFDNNLTPKYCLGGASNPKSDEHVQPLTSPDPLHSDGLHGQKTYNLQCWKKHRLKGIYVYQGIVNKARD